MTTTHVYQSIARATQEHGVSTMFGLMGDANLFMVTHLYANMGAALSQPRMRGAQS